jgi:DNA-binding transcriptional LysR family regulator
LRLDLLQTYDAVLTTGTTQAAAAQLGLSQSAVSRRLAQLEASLGLALFVRDRTRLVPTREGQLLQGQIRSLIDSAGRLAAQAEDLGRGNSVAVTLRVACPASLTLSVVPRIIAEFLAANDQVGVELHTGPYDAIERMLLDERAELGFIRLPGQRSGLKTTPLVTSRTVCVMPAGHPLAALPRIAVQDLRGVPLILLGRMRAPRRDIDDYFWRAGIRPKVRVEAHSVGSACGLVARGLGVTLVNELMALDFVHMPLAIRPLAETMVHDFAIATAQDLPPSTAARAFAQVTARVLRGMLG